MATPTSPTAKPGRRQRATRTRHVPVPPTTRGAGVAAPTLTRSTPLPGGRAVIGALLVTVSAVGVFVSYRSSSDSPTTPVLVVSRDLPPGHRIEGSDVRVERAELPAVASAGTYDSIGAVDGAVTLAPLRAGELLQRSAVLSSDDQPPGTRELSFAIDRERALNGTLRPGERVDVLATFGTGDSAYTSVIARAVEVLDTDTGGRSPAIGASGKVTITVSMGSADDLLRLAHASQVAPITLLRSTRAGGSDPPTMDIYRAPTGGADLETRTAGAVRTHPSSTTSSTGRESNADQRNGG